MAGKYFGIPFALSGDRSAIPDAAQPDGSVSFTQGFTLDYELENTDPNYKPVPREETNALYYDITEAIGIVQKQGFADWTIDATPYPINAFVRHNDIVWRNTVAGNSAEPGTDATWVDETISFVDTLNAPIANIAVASTVNLTTGAPSTSNIVFTGSGTINNFTVAANRDFIVRFDGVVTLTNSASLITNSGANIVTAAGDTCIMRATAANTVEILCGSFLQNASVGTLGQTWQNVTASRAANTTYTNTTGRTISVVISRGNSAGTGANSHDFLVNGISVTSASSSASAIFGSFSVMVPNGSTYRLNLTGIASLNSWSEMRT